MLLFQFHLSLEVGQQGLRFQVNSEEDSVEVIAGGLQGQSVQGQQTHHRLATREGAEGDTGHRWSCKDNLPR